MKSDYTHICMDGRCPYQNKPSPHSCECHLPRESMMLIEIGRLTIINADLEKIASKYLDREPS